ncbi:GAF domain-containing protein [Frankia sp. CNm7]|uniref:Oxygen sensor histidine kinase NreB n=1 Tax=Frankia nepalensis TaxID=1836974 RepID=A0A937REI6_9ACTN|nr:ATP-binding protein [Frankia nepalensis]MBL7499273.1 GAF domain-containing protein [Frankia nepalensis]MBL7513502.1 GAF domain-containing protein [Frankia nepalensis]MBL7520030.1 GAF domain-containing protein [Frankia nepalensis]MBL7628777.1 GAF domain-containing protein [Frankia nepalensis]
MSGGQAHPPTFRADPLAALRKKYTEIVASLDRDTAIRGLVTTVPGATGVDVAWVGLPAEADVLALGNPVNLETDVLRGLVVPRGVGLGGLVMAARRPMWVSDYLGAQEITHDFAWHVSQERIVSMIAVPVVSDGRLLGVLYGANRQKTEYSDVMVGGLETAASALATAQIVAERARHAAEVAVHEERHRLALELHDGVGAMLFTIGAGIRTLSAEPDLEAGVRSRLATLEAQTAQAAAALRGSMRVLSTTPRRLALGVALREHCRAFSERTGVPARVLTLTALPDLPAASAQTLVDVTREALVNVEKHARASSVVVSVFAMADGVAVAVSDDGLGIDPSVAAAATGAEPATGPDAGPGMGHGRGLGLGLASMTERLGRVGGTLKIEQNEDGGTTVRAWLPA